MNEYRGSRFIAQKAIGRVVVHASGTFYALQPTALTAWTYSREREKNFLRPPIVSAVSRGSRGSFRCTTLAEP